VIAKDPRLGRWDGVIEKKSNPGDRTEINAHLSDALVIDARKKRESLKREETEATDKEIGSGFNPIVRYAINRNTQGVELTLNLAITSSLFAQPSLGGASVFFKSSGPTHATINLGGIGWRTSIGRLRFGINTKLEVSLTEFSGEGPAIALGLFNSTAMAIAGALKSHYSDSLQAWSDIPIGSVEDRLRALLLIQGLQILTFPLLLAIGVDQRNSQTSTPPQEPFRKTSSSADPSGYLGVVEINFVYASKTTSLSGFSIGVRVDSLHGAMLTLGLGL
jgi:hypothetical protein